MSRVTQGFSLSNWKIGVAIDCDGVQDQEETRDFLGQDLLDTWRDIEHTVA